MYDEITLRVVGQKLVKFKTADFNYVNKEQKAPYFVAFSTKYGAFLTIYRTTQPHRVIPIR